LRRKEPKNKTIVLECCFGLQEVDGLKTSKYMIELSQEHIKGKKTYK